MNIADSKVLYRSLSGEMPIMVRGDGSWLRDSDGKRYLDMASSAGSATLGHSNFQVRQAVQGQMNMIPNVFGGFWASNAAEEAGHAVITKLGPHFSRVLFQNGGGEAVDLACKLAAQYHAEIDLDKSQFIALEHAFHGVGLLPFALTGAYPRYIKIEPYQTATRDNHILRADHPYNVGTAKALSSVDTWFSLLDSIAAIIIEPIGGPPLGCFPHEKQYLQRLREICDATDTLLIFDEVLCGSGRCGYLSVSEMYGVYPDITILGKGLSAGYVPMSAICLSNKVVERIAKGSGSVMFGTTNSAHTTGCAAVAATLHYMDDYRLYDTVVGLAPALYQLITSELARVPGVTGIRHCGYLAGLELRHPDTGTFLPDHLAFHSIARKCIMEQGVVVYTKGQTMFSSGDFITIAPPLETSFDDLIFGISKIKLGIENAYKQIRGENP